MIAPVDVLVVAAQQGRPAASVHDHDVQVVVVVAELQLLGAPVGSLRVEAGESAKSGSPQRKMGVHR